MSDGGSVPSEPEQLPGPWPRDRKDRRADTPADRSPSIELTLDPSRVVPWLLGAVAVLSVLSLIGQILDHGLDLDVPGLNTYVRYTDVDHEANIPTWFQSSVLMLNALVLWTIAGDSARRRDGWSRHWRLLALAFVYLSLDDLTEIHEQTIVPIQKLLGVGGFLYFAWILLALPLLAVFGLFYLRFLRALPRPVLKGILLAAALYVGGAIVLEMIGGQLFSSVGEDTVRYSLEAAGEELFEMLGMVTMLAVAARHLRATRGAAPARGAGPDTSAGWGPPVQSAPVPPRPHALPDQAYPRRDASAATDPWPGVVDLTDGRSATDRVDARSADRPRSGRRRRDPGE